MRGATERATDLYYEIHGDAGDPLVLVHGSWVDHSTFDLVLPILASGFRVLVYDRRGHGRSAAGTTPRTTFTDQEDLVRLMEATDLYPAHVAGNSLGGCVALRLAEHRPDLLRSLLVHEAPVVDLVAGPSPELDRAVGAMAEVDRRVRGGDAEGGARAFIETVTHGAGAWERLPATTRAGLISNAPSWPDEFADRSSRSVDRPRLAEFDPPALVTTGALSPVFFRAISDSLAEILPNAETRLLRDTGHVPHLTHPALYAGTIVGFCLERSVPTA